MLAKIWKKLLMFILIVACVFNVMSKLINNLSLEDELLSSAQYIQDLQDAQKAEENSKDDKEDSQKEEKKTQEKSSEGVVIVK